MMNSTGTKWKNRHELPVLRKLNFNIDIDRLRSELQTFSTGKIWDSLGSDYVSLCETHTRLPKMFFKEEELVGANHICDLDWEKTSYQQLSLTEYDADFSLEKRKEKSGSVWDNRIAKKNTHADERWFSKIKQDVPPYIQTILATIKGAHRARFAQLAPMSSVKPHIDYDSLYSIRIHFAVETNSECFNGGWDSAGNEVKMHIPADGSAWLVNPGLKHYAENGGATPRNHLIISVDSQDLISL